MTSVQRGHGQANFGIVAHAVITRRHGHAALWVDEAPLALPLHGGQSVAKVAHVLKDGADHQPAVLVQKSPGMAAQGLVRRHAAHRFQRGRQQHGGASVRQVADAAVGVGRVVRDVVDGGVVARARFVNAKHMAHLRVRGQGGAQRGQGAGDTGGADHS
ncbi:hypothetical protein D3C87_1453540 [compost metagenome]